MPNQAPASIDPCGPRRSRAHERSTRHVRVVLMFGEADERQGDLGAQDPFVRVAECPQQVARHRPSRRLLRTQQFQRRVEGCPPECGGLIQDGPDGFVVLLPGGASVHGDRLAQQVSQGDCSRGGSLIIHAGVFIHPDHRASSSYRAAPRAGTAASLTIERPAQRSKKTLFGAYSTKNPRPATAITVATTRTTAHPAQRALR